MMKNRPPFPLRPLRWALLAALVGLAACSEPIDFVKRGRDQIALGDYGGAVILLKNAVQAKPDAAEPRIALAEALERVGDTGAAAEQLRKALENGGDVNLVVPRLALLMIERNEVEKLIRDFKDRKLPNAEADATVRGAVALALVAQRRPADATAHIEGAAKTPAVALAQAQLLLVQGKQAEALAALANAKDAKDTAGTPWFVARAASRLAAASGDKAASLDWMRKAHEAAPWHRGLMGEYGEALIFAGRIKEAEPLRDKLRKEAPGYFWTHYLNASLLAHAGRMEEAHAAALRVVAAVPDHLPAGLIVAAAELSNGDFKQAEKRLRTLLQKHPGSLPALEMLAKAQLRTGQLQASAETVRRGLATAPDNAELLSLGAELDAAGGNPKKAAATVTALLAKQPDNPALVLRLAELKAALGDKAESQRLLGLAGTAAEKTPALLDRTVAAMLRLRDVKRARELADRVVSAHATDPQARLSLAATQVAQGDNAAAWTSTLAALDTSPAYAPALRALGAMARKPEQRKELLARYAKATDTKGVEASAHLQYSALLRADGQPDTAVVAALEKGLQGVPGNVSLRAELVQEYFRSGLPDKALTTAQAGAAVADADIEAQALLADVYERTGKPTQAIEAYAKLATANPQRTDWRMRLASLQAASGPPTEAVATLRRLMADVPGDPEAYVALAKLVLKSNPSEAMSVARQMAARPELAAPATILEGDLLALTDKLDDALATYAKAGKAPGVGPLPLLRTVNVLDKQNRKPAADTAMAEALRRFPDDVKVLRPAAERALAQGQAARAVELLKKALVRAPANPVLLNDLAWAQVKAGDPQAVENARKAVAAIPHSPNALDTLGVALGKAGKRDEAVVALKAAVNLSPATASTPRLHLAEQLVAAGDKPGAAAALQPILSTPLQGAERELLEKLKAAVAS